MIIAKFQEQVEKSPGNIAVKTPGRLFSYKELNQYANRVAYLIRQKCPGHRQIETVGLVLDHGVDMIAAILAVLKTGKIYVPISPDYPQNRISYLLDISEASLVITHSAYEKKIKKLAPGNNTGFINVEQVVQSGPGDRENIIPDASGNDLAYIMYTSGSTGRPKGVMQNHHNVLYYIKNWTRCFSISEADRMTLFSSFCHDGSVQDMFGALLNGAGLYPYDIKKQETHDSLARFLLEEKITIWHSVPSLFNYFVNTLKGDEKFTDLHCILLGGEPLRKYEIDMCKRFFPGSVLANVYGQTESSVNSIWFIYPETSIDELVIGDPLDNTELFVVDREGNEANEYEIGEIIVANPNISPGYWKDENLTGETFGSDPEFGRIYWTGDLGRRIHGGKIEFVGRKDFQVKIRGYRVEPGEIEYQLLKYEGIEEAAVIASGDQDGHQYLAAYFSGKEKIEIPRLRQYLQEFLPDYMIPLFFVQVDKFLLTPSGKINRKALPLPGAAGEKPVGDGFAPRNEIDKKLVKIWSEVLSNEEGNIDIDTDFFQLGGHSLNAMIMVSRIHKEFGVNVPLIRIFKTPFIRSVSDYIKEAEPGKFTPIEKAENKEYYPLSPSQKRMYILQRMAVKSTVYNMYNVMILNMRIEREEVEFIFKQLIRRHESFRTSFEVIEGEPVQKIHEEVKFQVENYTIRNTNPNIEDEVKSYIKNFIRPFDLSQAPLLRVGLIKLSHTLSALRGHPSQEGKENKYLLLVDMHHIISDGTSLVILTRDFAFFYAGEGDKLPLLTLQYKDFAEWLGGEAAGEFIKKQESFWLKEFEGEIPVLELPGDYPRPVRYSDAGSHITFALEKEKKQGLSDLALSKGASIYMVLLSVYTIWLSKLSGQEDIVVGTPVAGRRYGNVGHIIGVFINTLPMRMFPVGCKTVADFLAEIKEKVLEALENQDYPFEELVEHIAVNRDISRNPLFDTMFVLQNIDSPETNIPRLKWSPYKYKNKTSKFDLTLSAAEAADKLSFTLEYSTKLFTKATIERFINYFMKIISCVFSESPKDIKLSEIEIISAEEKRQVLFDFNDTGTRYPKDKTLHRLFEEQAARTPDHIAVVYFSLQITSAKLNEQSNRLMRHLEIKGLDTGNAVAIMTDPCQEMTEAILAVSKCGAFYLPIDPATPQGRIAYLLADSEAKFFLTHPPYSDHLNAPVETLDIKDKNLYLHKGDTGQIHSIVRPSAPVYLIYTSGTTGNPKGVMVKHENLVNYVDWFFTKACLTGADKTSLTSSFAFDLGYTAIYPALLKGVPLHILPKETYMNPELVLSYIFQQGLTYIKMTPTQFSTLVDSSSFSAETCRSLRLVVLGGEAIKTLDVEKAYRICRNLRIMNHYGPTETTIGSIARFIERDDLETFKMRPTIGRPIFNTKVYILDKYLNLLPTGIPGELCLGGQGLAEGYLNNPELTPEKFKHDLWDYQDYHDGYHRSYRSYKSYTIYRTGDLGRWLPNGNLEFLGRIDHQVKIRGYRIELGEIESRLLNVNGVKEVVVVHEEVKDDKYICAYFVAGIEYGISELREYLSMELPDYMIPSHFVPMDKLPLTPNGKIDRKALPLPVLKASDKYEAPRDGIEKKLLDIWSEVLGIEKEKIGINDNFFHLGGHSLKATMLVSRIHKELDVNVPFPEIFKNSHIRGLAAFIKNAETQRFFSIRAVEKREYYMLSSAQRRLFVLHRMDEKGIAYNMPSVWQLEGNLDSEKITAVLQQLTRRHESLRTSFYMVNDEPVQVIHDDTGFKIELLTAEDAEKTFFGPKSQELIAKSYIKDFIRPFDLNRAPLFRVGLIEQEEQKNILMVDMHHIISDGISIGIMVKEFMELYAGKGQPVLRLQYKDYSEWQHRQRLGKPIKQQEAYWLKEFFVEIPVLNLPTDYPRPVVQDFAGSRIHFKIDGEETNALKSLADEQGVTLFMLLLSLYTVCLSRLSGQEDIVVGTPVAGRRHADLEPIMGMFVNTLALRNFPEGQKPFIHFLEEVKENTVKAFENQEYLYEDLVEQVDLERDTGHNPLFDTMFALQNFDALKIEIPGLKVQSINYMARISKFDLTLLVVERVESLLFTFEYCTKLFKEETLRRFLGYFTKTVSTVIHNPGMRISGIEIIDEEEKSRILHEFNDTAADYPKDKTIHQLFEEQVERTPNNIALHGCMIAWLHGGRGALRADVDAVRPVRPIQLTYRELNNQSGKLAGLLIEKGIQPDTMVGIMIERSVEMIIGILGILKSGGAYLPIDVDYPGERIQYMLKDSGAKVVATDRGLSEKFEKLSIVNCQLSMNEAPSPSTLTSTCQVSPANLAYIIYTSGSTGQPKGVPITHGNLSPLLHWGYEHVVIGPMDRVIQNLSYYFDWSVWEIFLTLTSGACLYMIPRGLVLDVERYIDFIQRYGVTVLHITPTHFQSFTHLGKKLSTLRHLCIGAEKFGVELLLRSYGLVDERCRIYNMYGPTEATIMAAVLECHRADLPFYKKLSSVPIGKTLGNTALLIMDRYFKPCPVYVTGELFIAGDGVAPGYLNNPGLTVEKFCRSPLTLHYSPLYKSGDLSRWLPDGNIEFLGRIDHQVKIRGFRIELGEIETQLLKYPGIKEVVVISRENENNHKYIGAYVVSAHDIPVSELREYLLKYLPDYMIPSDFIRMEKIPLTPNGKVDRRALPGPEGLSLREEVGYNLPSNEVEKKLVEIWEKVLGRDNIGIDENFFMIGGDSIKSIQIISRMSSAGYKLEMKYLFQYPRISDLAPLVKKLKRIPDQSPIKGTIPLTPIQKDFFNKSHMDPHHYNQAMMLYSKEGFDRVALKEVFSKIQEHHDVLRMTYESNTGNKEIVQIGHDLGYPFFIQEYDLKNRGNSLEELNAKLNQVQASIDLEKGPLMKLGLFHLDDGDRLLIAVHHLVIDGVSWRILFEDIETLYGQHIRGEKLVLPPKTDSFKLWSEQLWEYANSKKFLKEIAYWQKLESFEAPSIPKDFDTDDNYVKDTVGVSFTLQEEETEDLLTKVNEIFRTEINDILLTALGMGIKRTWGHNRVLIALEGHGREEILEDMDISRTVGWFTSVYPVLLEVSCAADPGRQVKEIKETLRRIPKKGVGYGILRYLTEERNKKEIEFKLKPQISFNYLGQFDADVKQKSIFEIARESTGNWQGLNNRREYVVDVTGMTANNRLTMTISYNKSHFQPETMTQLIGDFESELKHLITFCCAQEDIELTPSDFTYKGMTIERVDSLMKEYRGIEDIYTLTPMQEGMLFHSLVDDRSSSYFEQMSYRLQGELDLEVVEKSLNEVFKRHDILRTVFVYKDIERPVQVVLKERAIDFYYEDISQIGKREEKQVYIDEYKGKDKVRSFNLEKDVLMRVAIFRVEESEYEFTWSHHHILMDGWCIGILNTEFFEIYASYMEKRPNRLPGVKAYRTYVQWLERQDKEESARYWANYLDSFEEPTGVPKSRISKEGSRYRNEEVSVILDKEKTAGLNKLAGRNQVTLNTVTQAVWGILLAKYNGKEDVVFGAVVSGRPSELKGVESMVGLFINTIPVRINFEEKMKFYRLLQQVQEEALAGERYHYHPLAEIQSGTALKQNLIDHLFVFENYPIAEQIEGYGREKKIVNKNSLELAHVEIFEQTNYDFNILLGGSDRLRITFKYNGNVYDRDYVERISKHFTLVVDQIIDKEALEVRELTLLSEEEKNLLLYEFNRTEADYPKNKTIHRRFEEQVEKTPDNIALHGGMIDQPDQSVLSDLSVLSKRSNRLVQLTYRQLNERSGQLAYLLMEKGVQPDTIVGIMVERSVEMMIGIMGILKSGGAYLPIEPEYPQDRIDYILKDSGVKILVTTQTLSPEGKKVRRWEGEKIFLDEIFTVHRSNAYPLTTFLPSYPLNSSNPGAVFLVSTSTLTLTSTSQVGPTKLAYIIYTSGSTGVPKGVMIEHSSVVNLLWVMQKEYPLGVSDTYLLKTSYVFDVSVTELFGWYMGGGRVVVLEANSHKDPRVILDTIERDCISHINFVPTVFNVFIETAAGENKNRLSGLKYIFLAGEALLPESIKRFGTLNTGIKLENLYGPTESTVYSSKYSLADWSGNGSIPIGKPLPNIKLYILNKNDQVQPLCLVGELCIGGRGLARGYLNRPELTAEKFVQDLWDYRYYHDENNQKLLRGVQRGGFLEKSPSGRRRQTLYKTGDLARWLPDGNIEFLGRMDHQVKIRGFRIELGEIETRLLKYPGIKEAVVISGDNENHDKYLCAYIVSAHDIPVSELREYLLKYLPDYMIPSYFSRLEKIPLSSNGKINRIMLPAPQIIKNQDHILPRNTAEEKLVDLWAKVLHIGRTLIGIHSNFFELGGHSLKATLLVAQIHKEFNVKIPLAELFRLPTISQLSEYMEKRTKDIFTTLEAVEEKNYYPASSVQRRLYFLQLLNPKNMSYNLPTVSILEGILDFPRLEETFKKLIKRHESLRTFFELVDGEVVQRIHKVVKFEIKYFNPGPEAEEAAPTLSTSTISKPLPVSDRRRREEIIKNFWQPFDLSQAPLLGLGIIKKNESWNILMMDWHHIISDGISIGIFLKDFMKLYQGEYLPELKLRYKDFSEWQNSPQQKNEMMKEEAYWQKEFEKEIPLLNLPADFPRPSLKNFEGSYWRFEIDKRELSELKKLAAREKTTLFTLLLAIFNVFLFKITGQEDIIVGTSTSGRRHASLDQIIGMFVNAVPLRNFPRRTCAFQDFLKKVIQRTISAFDSQDFQFEELVKKINPNTHQDNSRNPLFDVMFVLNNEERPELEIPGLTLKPYPFKKEGAQMDLKLRAIEGKEKIYLSFEYSTKLFKRVTMEMFAANFKEVLAAVIKDVTVKLEDIIITSGLTSANTNIPETTFAFQSFPLDDEYPGEIKNLKI